MKSQADQVRDYVRTQYIEPARGRGERTVRIVAGEIEHGVGLRNRTPGVCQALRSKKFERESGVVLEEQKGPPSGMSSTVEFIYRLTETTDKTTAEGRKAEAGSSSFYGLRGLLKDVYATLGGGKDYLLKERNAFEEVEANEHSRRIGR